MSLSSSAAVGTHIAEAEVSGDVDILVVDSETHGWARRRRCSAAKAGLKRTNSDIMMMASGLA